MWKNQLKTVFLLTSLSSLILLLGYFFNGAAGVQIAFIIALIINGISYFFSESIVLKLYKAKKLDPEKYAEIYDMTKDLADQMKIPMPKLWIINSPIANAFATGRNPSHASVALSSGIIELLNHNELRGVIAHELSHIKNRDILISTIAAALATTIGYLAHSLRFTAFYGGSSHSGQKRTNPVGLMITAILMPFAASLIRLGISRSREYLADESGAKYSQDPLALADALKKLHNHTAKFHLNKNDIRHQSTASLFIIHPFREGSWIVDMFSTHPSLNARIKRLQEIYEQNIT